MKKLFKVLIALTIGMLIFTSCENWKAKHLGGTMTIELPPRTQFVNATWKDTDLWYLIEADSSFVPKTYYFKEKSTFGNLEGTENRT